MNPFHKLHRAWLRRKGEKAHADRLMAFERQENEARRRGDMRAIGNVREARRAYIYANLAHGKSMRERAVMG
jgi:hypothetical protein